MDCYVDNRDDSYLLLPARIVAGHLEPNARLSHPTIAICPTKPNHRFPSRDRNHLRQHFAGWRPPAFLYFLPIFSCGDEDLDLLARGRQGSHQLDGLGRFHTLRSDGGRRKTNTAGMRDPTDRKVQLSETPPYWARPSVPLGYHRPVWP
jgi:hypothetical protein